MEALLVGPLRVLKTIAEQGANAAQDIDPEWLGKQISNNDDFGCTHTFSGGRKDNLKAAEFGWTQDLTTACVYTQREVGAGDASQGNHLHCKINLASVLNNDDLRW